jgi:hypothetical protein
VVRELQCLDDPVRLVLHARPSLIRSSIRMKAAKSPFAKAGLAA